MTTKCKAMLNQLPLISYSVPHLRKTIFSLQNEDQQNCLLASFPLEYFGRLPFKNKPSEFLSLTAGFLNTHEILECDFSMRV